MTNLERINILYKKNKQEMHFCPWSQSNRDWLCNDVIAYIYLIAIKYINYNNIIVIILVVDIKYNKQYLIVDNHSTITPSVTTILSIQPWSSQPNIMNCKLSQ